MDRREEIQEMREMREIQTDYAETVKRKKQEKQEKQEMMRTRKKPYMDRSRKHWKCRKCQKSWKAGNTQNTRYVKMSILQKRPNLMSLEKLEIAGPKLAKIRYSRNRPKIGHFWENAQNWPFLTVAVTETRHAFNDSFLSILLGDIRARFPRPVSTVPQCHYIYLYLYCISTIYIYFTDMSKPYMTAYIGVIYGHCFHIYVRMSVLHTGIGDIWNYLYPVYTGSCFFF